MDLITGNLKFPLVSPVILCYPTTNNKGRLFCGFRNHPFQFYHFASKSSFVAITQAKKRNSQPESPVLKPSIIEEVSDDEEEDDLLVTDDFVDEDFLDEGDYFEDEYVDDNAEVYAGDGAEGGGISLCGTWWDKQALAIAEDVTESFDGDLGIYAVRTLANATIQVRIEKPSAKSGSPSVTDIEAFSAAYRARLDDSVLAKTIPENISLELLDPLLPCEMFRVFSWS